MRKRLLGVLVGSVLLVILCLNVFAYYTDDPKGNHGGEPIGEAVSVSQPLDTAFHTVGSYGVGAMYTNAITQKEVPEEKNGTELKINGVSIAPLDVTTVINDTTYISIRTMLESLGKNVWVEWQNGQLVASGDGFSMTAKPGNSYFIFNDHYIQVPDGVIFYKDSTMAPIRLIGHAMGASTQWDVMAGDISVNTTGAPLQPNAPQYNSEDLYWLSRIIFAESGNQPLKGKIAVGTVIMNRVESPKFPNTVRGVIFAPNQFTPAMTGSINREPSEECVYAAKLVLDGAREAGGSLYFNQAGVPCWASQNKSYVTTIADHSFYQ